MISILIGFLREFGKELNTRADKWDLDARDPVVSMALREISSAVAAAARRTLAT